MLASRAGFAPVLEPLGEAEGEEHEPKGMHMSATMSANQPALVLAPRRE